MWSSANAEGRWEVEVGGGNPRVLFVSSVVILYSRHSPLHPPIKGRYQLIFSRWSRLNTPPINSSYIADYICFLIYYVVIYYVIM